jgi:hypothetical protein
MSEFLHLAAALARTRLVVGVAGLPDFNLFADPEVLVDPKILKDEDLEHRVEVFKCVQKSLNEGLANLPLDGAPHEKVALVQQSIDRCVQGKYHVWDSMSMPGKLYVRELQIPASFEVTTPRNTVPSENGAGTRAERIAVTHIDTLYLARVYADCKNSLPYTTVKPLVADILQAHKDGVLYEPTWKPSKGNIDEPVLSKDAREELLKLHRSRSKKVLVTPLAMEHVRTTASALPNYYAREKRRQDAGFYEKNKTSNVCRS